MLRINAKNFALPVSEVIKFCKELEPYLKSNKLDLGDSKSLQVYNKCLFQILEGIEIKITDQNNLIPACGLRRAIISIILQRINPKKVIEIGTGAYAIMALLLARNEVQVIATEINDSSFQSAKAIVKLNSLNDKILLVKSSGEILSSLNEYFPADCILSLPPYYAKSDRKETSKGFLGVDSELYSEGSAEGFSFTLINEWFNLRHSIKNLCILWKNKDAMNKGRDYLSSLSGHSINIAVEVIEISAGTRTRFLTIFKSMI